MLTFDPIDPGVSAGAPGMPSKGTGAGGVNTSTSKARADVNDHDASSPNAGQSDGITAGGSGSVGRKAAPGGGGGAETTQGNAPGTGGAQFDASVEDPKGSSGNDDSIVPSSGGQRNGNGAAGTVVAASGSSGEGGALDVGGAAGAPGTDVSAGGASFDGDASTAGAAGFDAGRTTNGANPATAGAGGNVGVDARGGTDADAGLPEGMGGQESAGASGSAGAPSEAHECKNSGEDVVVLLTAPNMYDGEQHGSYGILHRFRSDGTPAWSTDVRSGPIDTAVAAVKVADDGAAYVMAHTWDEYDNDWLRMHKFASHGAEVLDGRFPLLVHTYGGNCYCNGREIAISGTIAYVGGRCDCKSATWRVDLSGVDATLTQMAGASYVGRLLLGPPDGLMVVLDDQEYSQFMVRHVSLDDLGGLPTGNWTGPTSEATPDYPFGSTCGAWNAVDGTAWVGGTWYRPETNRTDRDLIVFAVSPELAKGEWPQEVFRGDSGYDDILVDLAVDSQGSSYLAARYEATWGMPTWWLKKILLDGTEVTAGWDQRIEGVIARQVAVDGKDEVYFLGLAEGETGNAIRLRKHTAEGKLCWDQVVAKGTNIRVAYEGMTLAPCAHSAQCQ